MSKRRRKGQQAATASRSSTAAGKSEPSSAEARRQQRRERTAQLREAEQRRERRRRILIYGGTAVALVVVIALVTVAVLASRGDDQLRGLQTFDGLSSDHVEEPVTYEQSPPVGGEHYGQWLNCGIYSEPVPNENAVHALEHGAVWITYRPGLGDDQVEQLREFVRDQDPSARSHLVLSPYEDLPAPVVASAWGRQLQLNGPNDPRLAAFTDEFVQGPQTPEPGAPCEGGVGEPSE